MHVDFEKSVDRFELKKSNFASVIFPYGLI